jgi:hypothetical protein
MKREGSAHYYNDIGVGQGYREFFAFIFRDRFIYNEGDVAWE